MLTTAFVAVAQTTPVDTTNGKPYYILLKDGSHIQGRIIKRDSTVYTVRMKNGQITYVDKELMGQLSNFAPVTADSAAYFTQTGYNRPNTSRPNQMTASPSQYVVTLTDGTTLNGEVLSQDASRLVLKTTSIGTVYVPAERVLRMERIAAARPGSNQRDVSSTGYTNLFPQYLYFTPTAYQAEKGRVYFRNSFIYLNQIDVGITNNWSVGAGIATPIAFVFAGWLSTKVSVPIGPRARVGLQGQYFLGRVTFFTSETFNASFFQGVLSLGDSQNNVTIGLGKSFDNNINGALLTVGLVRKVNSSFSFISENQLVLSNNSNTTAKLGAGVRFDRQRHSFDISANVALGISGNRQNVAGFGFLPWASYQVRMGK